jgi:hypothetical protein
MNPKRKRTDGCVNEDCVVPPGLNHCWEGTGGLRHRLGLRRPSGAERGLRRLTGDWGCEGVRGRCVSLADESGEKWLSRCVNEDCAVPPGLKHCSEGTGGLRHRLGLRRPSGAERGLRELVGDWGCEGVRGFSQPTHSHARLHGECLFVLKGRPIKARGEAPGWWRPRSVS